ncbi:MAG: OadG family protein [Propionibacteriaceae bacterium]|nr:OadG family protein [Propionibacteriaceae bacterium]
MKITEMSILDAVLLGLLALTIVLTTLFLIQLLIGVLNKGSESFDNRGSASAKSPQLAAKPDTPALTQAASDDGALVAAITAALSEYLGATVAPKDILTVRPLAPAVTASAWTNAAKLSNVL